MIKVNFKFSNDKSGHLDILTVNLFDTPLAKSWAYAVALNNKERNFYIKFYDRKNKDNEIHKQELYNKILNCIEQLADSPYPYNNEILPKSVAEVDQPMLNRLHRHFTNTNLQICSDTFTDFEIQRTLNPPLQELNNQIHFLETYMPRMLIPGKELCLLPTGTNNTGYDIRSLRSYHSFDHVDLIMDPYILGKTLLQSFFNQDIPMTWDTSGHVRTSGGAIMVIDNHRQQVYNSPEFKDWLESYNLSKEQVFADMPLGNFENGHKDRLLELIKLPNFIESTCETKIIFD